MEADVLQEDPRRVGRWLQFARKAAGRSQQEAADHLGIARTTVTAIEKGERRVQPAELLRFAQFYGRSSSELLRSGDPDEDFSVQLRAAIAPHDNVSGEMLPILAEFQQLCEDYVELERVAKAQPLRQYPPERTIPRDDVEHAAEDVAVEERHRLGLGDGPIHNLREILEQDVGIRIFMIPMPSRVDAMFAFSEKLGACIAVNAKHPRDRQHMSQAHEYAHFLASRRQSEIQVADRFVRMPSSERFANAFARSFLMPASGLRRRFNDAKRSRDGNATVADLITLAGFFGVSFETLSRRLEELRLIKSGTLDSLQMRKFAVRKAQAVLGLSAVDEAEPMLPLRYVALAVEAYRDAALTEGRLSRFLRLDRLDARRVLADALSEDGDDAVVEAGDE